MDRQQRRVVTLAVMLGMFLAALDTTVVATALPTIAHTLGGLELYPWVAAAYSLTLTAASPVFGGLADRYGRRRVYVFGIAAFLAGSVLCGAAASMPQLVLFRALQGVGGGALLPVAITIVGDLYTLEERARVQGLFSGVWGLASVIGPLLGGFIVDTWSWRWIFYLNLPVGMAALWVVARAYREKVARAEGSVDAVGAALLVASVGLVLYSLAGVRPQLGLMISGLGLAAAFLWWERRVRHPLVPLWLFANRLVSATSVTGFLVGAALFGSLYYVPLFVQGVRGGAPTEAGVALTPLMLAWSLSSTVGGGLALRLGFRLVAYGGVVVLATGFALLTRLGAATPAGWLWVATALLGTGMGLVVLVTVLSVQDSVAYGERGVATSLTLFFRSIGGAVGVSALGGVLLWRLRAAGVRAEELARLLDPVLPSEGAAPSLEVMRTHLADAMGMVFAASLGLSLLALVSVRWFPPGRVLRARKTWAAEPGD